MTERELKCISQRVVTSLDNHEDTKALLAEVKRLRGVLADVRDMTGDPAIINTIKGTLEC